MPRTEISPALECAQPAPPRSIVRRLLPYLVFLGCASVAAFCWAVREHPLMDDVPRDFVMVLFGLASLVVPVLLQMEKQTRTYD